MWSTAWRGHNGESFVFIHSFFGNSYFCFGFLDLLVHLSIQINISTLHCPRRIWRRGEIAVPELRQTHIICTTVVRNIIRRRKSPVIMRPQYGMPMEI